MSPFSDKLFNIVHEVCHSSITNYSGERRIQHAINTDLSQAFQLRLTPKYPYSLIAIGKAARSMFYGMIQNFQHPIHDALIIHPKGYEYPNIPRSEIPFPYYECITGHPIPDQQSLQAGETLVQYLSDRSNNNFIFLISGGTSACVEKLNEDVDLKTIQMINRCLVNQSVDIEQINLFRSAFSQLKGGGLLKFLNHRRWIQLSLSDVAGDSPQTIGSGLLFPSQKSLSDDSISRFCQLIESQSITELTTKSQSCNKLGHSDLIALMSRLNNLDPLSQRGIEYSRLEGHHHCLANSRAIASDLANKLSDAFRLPLVNLLELDSDFNHTLQNILDVYKSLSNGIVVWHGETTLDLCQQPGKGGRNSHLCLSVAAKISELSVIYPPSESEQWCFFSLATDGKDGNSFGAGGMVCDDSWATLHELGVEPKLLLSQFDSYTGLNLLKTAFNSFPGRTNLRDVAVMIKASSLTIE